MATKFEILSLYIDNNKESPSKKTRQQYSLDYKLKVIEHSKLLKSIRLASEAHGLNESQVHKWRKEEAKILKAFEERSADSKCFKIGKF